MSKGIVFRNHQNEKIYPCSYYPIGSIFLSISNINPSTFFGGRWEQIKDRFLLCAGNNYTAGNTGGEANHTLSIFEMPSHNHGQVKGSYSPHYVIGIRGDGGGGGNNTAMPSSMSYQNNTYSGNYMDNVGGGQAHNNMPPYLVVYAWKRVS